MSAINDSRSRELSYALVLVSILALEGVCRPQKPAHWHLSSLSGRNPKLPHEIYPSQNRPGRVPKDCCIFAALAGSREMAASPQVSNETWQTRPTMWSAKDVPSPM